MQTDLFTPTQAALQTLDLSNCPAVVDPNQLPDILNHLDRVDTIALDVETTGLDYVRDHLHGIAVSTPLQDWYITGQALPTVINPLTEIVAAPHRLTIGHNIKFDLHFLMRKGIKPAWIADTMVAAYLCDENRELGLKPLAHSVLGMTDLPSFSDLLKDAKKRLKAKKLADVSIYDVDLPLLATYAARDTRLTLKLWDVIQYELNKEGMTEIFWNTEMPFLWTLLDMEDNGMHVNASAVAALRSDLEIERSKHLEAWINLTDGINHNSSKQVRELLFGKMKLPAQDKTKKGDDSVNALTLQRLEPLDNSGIVHALRGIRQYEKLIETFIAMLEDKPFDGYLHGNFNQTGTVTGRLSSSDPNQQNIPSRGELGKKVRTVFDAPDGMDLVVIDYSQVEMRMLAHESKDENLLRAFRENIDVHQLTADRAGVKRSEAKALNFGWCYGISYLGLMDAIEKAAQPRPSAKDAKKWLKDYDQAYPTLVRWKSSVIRRARQLGYVPTIAGHHRRLPDLSSPHERFRMAAERQCVNARIQGCKSSDSRIATTSGYVKIGDLYQAQQEGNPFTILTYTGASDQYNVYQTGSKKVYRIRTNAGFDTVSADHRFFVYANGDLIAKKLSELAVGDMVVSLSPELQGYQTCPFSEDDAELVGILVGDGSYSMQQNVFYVSYGHDNLYADHVDGVIRRVLGRDLHISRRKSKASKGNSWQLTIYGRTNRERLNALGLERASGEYKTLPEWLFTAPIGHRLAALRGMFDTDGGLVNKTYAGFTNISRDLVEGFASLAMSVGIPCDVFTHDGFNGGKRVWRCIVRSVEDTKNFIEMVRPAIPHKCKVSTDHAESAVYKVPDDLKKDVAHLVYGSGAWKERVSVTHDMTCSTPGTWKRRIHTSMTHKNFSYIERHQVHNMLKGQGASQKACMMYLDRIVGTVDENARLNLIDLVGIRWATILSITDDGVRDTYDIEIHDQEHAYIGQGLLEHNSCADMLKWAMIQLEPWERMYGAKRQVQVHDELGWRCPRETSKQFAEIASSVMKGIEKQFKLIVPIEADYGIGDNWATAK